VARRGFFVVLLGLGGCVIEPPASSRPGPEAPPPLAEQIRQEALRESPAEGILLAERRFASGVWNFRAEVHRVASTGAPPGDDDLAGLLVLFAWALERAPQGEVVGAGEAANEMREAAQQMRSAGPAGSPPVREAFGRGLRLGVEALLALARGPYGEATEVADRAADLAASLDPAAESLPPVGYAGMVEPMRRAVELMESMIEASTTSL
jgi:hypothetical protein